MRIRDCGCVVVCECRGGGGSYGGGPGRVTLAAGPPGTPLPTPPRATSSPQSPSPGARGPPAVLHAPGRGDGEGGMGRQLARWGSWPLRRPGRWVVEEGAREAGGRARGAKRAAEREARSGRPSARREAQGPGASSRGAWRRRGPHGGKVGIGGQIGQLVRGRKPPPPTDDIYISMCSGEHHWQHGPSIYIYPSICLPP